jgi:RNA polymerase sigma factor (sigma-70 family)
MQNFELSSRANLAATGVMRPPHRDGMLVMDTAWRIGFSRNDATGRRIAQVTIPAYGRAPTVEVTDYDRHGWSAPQPVEKCSAETIASEVVENPRPVHSRPWKLLPHPNEESMTLLINSTTGSEPSRTAADSVHRLSEKRLVEAAQNGHPTAFDTLYERYARRVFRTAHRVTRNREDAEDAVQDALLRAFLHIRDFDGRSSFVTWLTRIAINSALMILRKRRTSLEVVAKDCDDFADTAQSYKIPDRAPNPERRYLQNERVRALKTAVQALRPSLRQVVEIQQFQERSLQETAAMMSITVAATKSRLLHARVALRKSTLLKLMQPPQTGNGLRALSTV